MINKLIAHVLPYMPEKLIWQFSKRYIAGETMDDGISVARQLNAEGVMVTIDLLGEFITKLEQAEENKNQYLDIIERFCAENIKGNFSLKPSMFGLLLDTEVCYRHVREIVQKAAACNSFVRIDMEDSQCVDPEIDIFQRLKKEFSGHVGLVMQAYLRRTLNDLGQMAQMPSNGHPLNFRLCKGIYVEPAQIAYKEYQSVRDHYLEDLEYMFKHNMYVGIATHDKYLVEGAMELIDRYSIPKDMYEFQMLYGVTPELRKSIVDRGHKMRVYVPFGKEWFGYSTRRLKENPKMASHIIKALFFRG
ncbi:proline dehydrogenase family protein [Mangrovibacterium diazotrophicum]|uniref:proline dehydrogenase n=1 Tax=Mangrovibacterium diazotrophicum TaxID=1261403 RepID=A0A419VV61_9BACT|nr:proline dehydrogenase family protein [Mangrovibacterium diazotrophicum]RKD86011.1 L-proline dehydrogenase [Mangrovibacterium diazotrophicum]